ncbi:MAG TPA: aminotransferase class I/II-fold pyridoxal phosphate-dependent enzyme, partial [Anaerolineae bacterium]|nr:aminotransferase class I/II-fold pyridoxal phosphate-dependent enzyme [Anaerolineae bacterium]
MPSIFTQAVHAGERQPAPAETPVTTPIYHSVGYLEPSAAAMEAVFAGEQAGYVYRRYESPTVDAFERAVAALEGGEAAFATASGMAAVNGALMSMLRAGDHVVSSRALFGSCLYILEEILRRFGVEVTFVDGTYLDQWRAAIRPGTRAVFFESMSNPTLEIIDIRAVSDIAHAAGAL